ncbi:acyltransferase family protein [Desulfonatronum thioautotrophicum]|uniref:acyltransferase family protein n=1 Tax=Desulfonatronum thioautotrophicum TaxID=617001 RepID=UPI0005EB2451|nr:acyltransferase [Desulfonatronum thioautotrophicum]
MTTPRLTCIDWLKCLGMLLIVLGHTGGTSAQTVFPATPKQLGVALFFFVLGFVLARDQRRPGRVVYNRLFDVYLFGGLCAVCLSAIMLVHSGTLNKSNYLPLLGGVNVVFNFYPANPSLWYLGTYLHLLLLWFVLARHWRIRAWMLVASAGIEIAVRALLFAAHTDYIAYMLLTNWITVFLAGMAAGQRWKEPPPRWTLAVGVTLLTGLFFIWSPAIQQFSLLPGFPFGRVVAGGQASSLLLTSACVSALYLGATWLVFQVTRHLGDFGLVRFLARNTLVVFLLQMPLIFALSPYVHAVVQPGPVRILVNLAIYYLGLALFSEVLRHVLQPRRLRDWLAARWNPPAAPKLADGTT